jgi:hypothetical protein
MMPANHSNSVQVIRMFVSDDDGSNVVKGFPNQLQPLPNLKAAEPGINQNLSVSTLNEQRIPGAARTKHA